jgi:hypothetical protein
MKHHLRMHPTSETTSDSCTVLPCWRVTRPGADGLPDRFTISDLTVDAQGQVTITVKNLGPERASASAHVPGLSAHVSLSQGWRQPRWLGAEEGALAPSSAALMSTLFVQPRCWLMGRGQLHRHDRQRQHHHRSTWPTIHLTRTLSCSPRSKPDLARVSVELDNGCRSWTLDHPQCWAS